MSKKEKAPKNKAGKKVFKLGLVPKVVAIMVIAMSLSTFITVNSALNSAAETLQAQTMDYLLDVTKAYGELLDADLLNYEDYLYSYDTKMDRMTYTQCGISELESSYGYIVDRDGIMQVHPTESKIGEPVTNDTIKKVIADIQAGKGMARKSEVVQYNFKGVDKYAAYYVSFDTQAVLVIGADKEEVLEEIESTRNRTYAISVIILIIGVAVVATVLSVLLKPLVKTVVNTTNMSDGDISVDSSKGVLNGNDEVSQLVTAYNNLKNKLGDIVGVINSNASNMNTNGQELVETVGSVQESINDVLTAIDEIAQGATSQAQDTEECTRSLCSLDDAIVALGNQINNLKKAAVDANNSAVNAMNSMNTLVGINNKTKEDIDVIVAQSNSTAAACSEINNFVDTINEIASQTSLLSLNASIEAARAGESGRGFAVVAGEIQKLSDQSASAAQEVQKIVESLTSEIENTAKLANNLGDSATLQLSTLSATSGEFDKVNAGVKAIDSAAEQIASEVVVVTKAKDDISGQITSLSALAQENAASSEETTASATLIHESVDGLNSLAERIQDISNELVEEMKFFKQ